MNASRSATGFTLIELVVVICVSTIVMGFIAAIIGRPMDMYLAQSRRAELTDSADSLSLNLNRDLVNVVPNGVRRLPNGNVTVLEILVASDWAHYYAVSTPADPPNTLDVNAPDKDFKVAGWLTVTTSNGTSILNAPAADPYQTGPGKVTNSAAPQIAPAGPGEFSIKTAAAFKYAGGSPTQRIYFISEPITYLCDTNAKTIRRYHGYKLKTNQTTINTAAKLTAAGATSSLIATNVAACQFNPPAPGGQVLTIDVTFTKAAASTGAESARLFRQFYLQNVP